jgi:hypothetical protein
MYSLSLFICIFIYVYLFSEWILARGGNQHFLAASIRPVNDEKWVGENEYQYTNTGSNIETGASCQRALGCVLLGRSSRALRGLLKEKSKIEADVLAVGRYRALQGMLEAAG